MEREFVKAMKLFHAGKFDTASALFVHIIKDYPHSHRTTGAFIMGGKAFYEVKNYRESVRLLKNLIDLYPQSRLYRRCPLYTWIGLLPNGTV